nr:hypothetical protein [uncultured Brevundimonas sp.]
MQALVELIAGLIALLAAAVLSQFGVEIHSPRQIDREVHRTTDCNAAPQPNTMAVDVKRDC